MRPSMIMKERILMLALAALYKGKYYDNMIEYLYSVKNLDPYYVDCFINSYIAFNTYSEEKLKTLIDQNRQK